MFDKFTMGKAPHLEYGTMQLIRATLRATRPADDEQLRGGALVAEIPRVRQRADGIVRRRERPLGEETRQRKRARVAAFARRLYPQVAVLLALPRPAVPHSRRRTNFRSCRSISVSCEEFALNGPRSNWPSGLPSDLT